MSAQSTAHADPFTVLQAPGGAEVHLLRTRKYKSAILSWVLECPLDAQRASRALLPDLLTRGTARYPGLADLNARCEELYAADLSAGVSSHGSLQLLRFRVDVLADRFAEGRPLLQEAGALLVDVLHRPLVEDGRFRADYFEQERENLLHSIAALGDDKGHHAYRRLMETMHAGTPYALHPWGTTDDAAALTEEVVREAWADVVGRAPARLFVVGDVTEEAALAVAVALQREGRCRPPSRSLPVIEGAAPALRREEERQPLAQSKLAIGFRLGAPWRDTAAASLATVVLGGDAHSRLFKRVREAESLAYGCGASFLPDSGTVVVQAGIDGDAAARVEELVLEEVRRLANEGVSEEELSLSRRAQRRRLDHLQDEPSALCGFRLNGLLSGRPHVLQEARQRVEAVTPDQIADVAAALELDTVFLLKGTAS